MSVRSPVPGPTLPTAPKEYDDRYLNDLVSYLNHFIREQRNPGELRGTKMVLTELPTSSVGLESGSLWNDSNTVKIVP